MKIPATICLILNVVGWRSERVTFESPTVTIIACSRCGGYMLQSHGLHFTGKIKRMPKEFREISGLLEGIGYTAAAGEVRHLVSVMAQNGLT